MYHREIKPGLHAVTCPWRDNHTTGFDGDGSTVVFDGSDGKPQGFKCHHSHCADKTIKDVIAFFTDDSEIGGAVRESSHDGFRFESIKEVLNGPAEKVSFLVDGLLVTGGNSIVIGKPKSGKTTVARQLALAVATGNTFLGRAVSPGPVYYIAAEDKLSEVIRHFKEMGATGEEKLFIHSGQSPKSPFEQLKEIILEEKPALIVFDTMMRVVQVKDGNDYAEMTKVLNPIIELSHLAHTHILVVHHAGKANDREAGDSALGSTAIFGSFDTLIKIDRKKEHRTVTSIQRYCDDMEETILDFDPIARTVTLGGTKAANDLGAVKVKVLEYLKAYQGFYTQAQIVEILKVRKETLKVALNELYDEDRILRDGEGIKGSPYKYCYIDPSEWQGKTFEDAVSGPSQ